MNSRFFYWWFLYFFVDDFSIFLLMISRFFQVQDLINSPHSTSNTHTLSNYVDALNLCSSVTNKQSLKNINIPLIEEKYALSLYQNGDFNYKIPSHDVIFVYFFIHFFAHFFVTVFMLIFFSFFLWYVYIYRNVVINQKLFPLLLIFLYFLVSISFTNFSILVSFHSCFSSFLNKYFFKFFLIIDRLLYFYFIFVSCLFFPVLISKLFFPVLISNLFFPVLIFNSYFQVISRTVSHTLFQHVRILCPYLPCSLIWCLLLWNKNIKKK